MNDGELWSFFRSMLSQGGDIWIDHQDKSYEEYSTRLDAAARERLDQFKRGEPYRRQPFDAGASEGKS